MKKVTRLPWGLRLQSGNEPSTQLLSYLAEKELLLLLDTFEHLLTAAQWLSQLLRSAPGVTLLVTTRARLDLQGEWLVEVGGLTVPDDEHGSAIEQSGAGQLWVQTARRVQGNYRLVDDDCLYVAQVCRMVEGMPLAIELAAAWVRLLPCTEIAREIAKGLALLTTTARDIPERHRSLRAVLDHSWERLSRDEQRVLRQFSVFRGGLERDAGAQLVGASLTDLVALVDKSLLRSRAQAVGQPRYDMHELVRQYAFEQLEIAGQMEQTRNAHLRYFLELAEQAATHLTGAEQGRWVLRMEAEYSNLRTALDWSLQSRAGETAARMCAALWRFWQTRGNFAEGRQWIARVLEMADQNEPDQDRLGDAAKSVVNTNHGLPKTVRAHVLKGAGVLAWAQSDYAEARASFETSLALYQELDDSDGIAAVSSNLGVLALYQGDYEQATALLEMSLGLRRKLRDKWGTAVCLNNLGAMAGKRGNLTLAETYYEEALALYRELGYERGIAILLGNLGDVAQDQGRFDRAHKFSMESLVLLRKLGDTAGTASALTRLGSLALRRNDSAQARTYYAESMTLFQTLGDKEYLAICWEGFASVAAAQQQWERATRLWGAAEAVRGAINVPLEPSLREEYQRNLARVQTQLDEQAFAGAWAEGHIMSVEQITAYALDTYVIESV